MQQKNTKYEQKKQALHKHTNTTKKFQNAETTNKPKNSYTTNDKKQ